MKFGVLEIAHYTFKAIVFKHYVADTREGFTMVYFLAVSRAMVTAVLVTKSFRLP